MSRGVEESGSRRKNPRLSDSPAPRFSGSPTPFSDLSHQHAQLTYRKRMLLCSSHK